VMNDRSRTAAAVAAFVILAIVAVSVGDSVRAAVAAMAAGCSPELVVRDRFANGLVFAPVAPPQVSIQQPVHQ
jgi:hypothetical protein